MLDVRGIKKEKEKINRDNGGSVFPKPKKLKYQTKRKGTGMIIHQPLYPLDTEKGK
jgi:hypothetical protein